MRLGFLIRIIVSITTMEIRNSAFQSKLMTHFIILVLFLNQGCFFSNMISMEDSGLLVETRAVWLNDYAFNSIAARNATISKMQAANLNTVFLIAPPIEDNKGWSGKDDFAITLDALNKVGVSVHVWVANLYRRVGHIADFTNDTERSEQVDWAISLLNTYPQLDGIHFDYLRTEELEPVNETKMDAISELIRETKARMNSQVPDKFLTTAGWPLSGEIRTPQDELPEWYNEWFEEFEANPINRWAKEGYDYNGYPTCFGVQQDPVMWLSDMGLDFHISMEYCYETSWWKGEVDIWNTFPNDVVDRVFMGVGWYSGVWEDEDWTEQQVAEEIVKKIQYGREHSITGFSIFEFGEPNNNDDVLITTLSGDENAPFWNEAISAFDFSEDWDDSDCSILLTIIIVGTISLVILAYYRKE